ncbi:glycosyltransferase family 4 protein [Sulfuriroseicoccus oceanibius]|uniref:Glycosyltransferase family 4 protein n=1 Tax=Sulfuriroseicoccus oceanibius TaxID=2707525 RepID=A0A6B3LC77_9BACT|nr:glycosyltransferase family 4 protein [Sulfuriroseicoccus oceanibius]QQL45712.1 glycosyltransferase family 4 protein [Sulfuriroseicoccus oceanibius]
MPETNAIIPDLTAPLPTAEQLPTRLLYAIATPVGGAGLPTTAAEGIRAAADRRFLGTVVTMRNRQQEVAPHHFLNIGLHPARWLAQLRFGKKADSGIRKLLTAHVAANQLESGKFDCFHSWSEDCREALQVARRLNIPSLIEIPTWHRNKGQVKPFTTASERKADDTLEHRLTIPRQHTLTEYTLADVILVQSQYAAKSFIAAGIPEEKIFLVYRGVDPSKFRPTVRPADTFRLVFVGALIKRKGVHHILEAWHRLGLKNAELVLVGNIEPEIKPYLEKFAGPSVTVAGFVKRPQDYLESASAFIFPSELEGSAKATFEASACSLAQITTRESGDAVVDGETGRVIPPNDVDALQDAIQWFYDHPEEVAAMGDRARERMVNGFTWDHHRQRLLHAYAYAKQLVATRAAATPSAP